MNRSEKILILFGFINPVIYILNANFLLMMILIEILILMRQKEERESKFWKIFLLGYSYFGVDILGIKLYDLVVLFGIPIFIKKRKHILNKSTIIDIYILIIYIIYLTIILVKSYLNGNNIAEYARYIFCFALIILSWITLYDKKVIEKVLLFIRVMALKVIISGIMIGILGVNGLIEYIYTSKLLNVKIHSIISEFRITAFFSDPNKMFLFLLSLLIIYELYMYKKDKNNKVFDSTNIILIIGSLISLSRTALLIVFTYILLKVIYAKILRNNSKNIIIMDILISIIIIVAFVFLKNILVEIIDYIILSITKILGRDSTISHTSSLLNDSRIISSKFALASLSSNWVVGLGFEAWSELYYMPPHNTVVSILQETGIIGLTLWISLFRKIILKVPAYIYVPLFLIPLLTFDLQTYRFIYILLGFCIIL